MPTLQFHGEEIFAAPVDRVYAALTDLDALARTLPDAVSTERIDDRTLGAVVRPGFSFLRGTMKLRIALEDLQPSASAQMRIEAQGIGVAMTVVSQMLLSAEGESTRAAWQADVVQMKGLVATVSPGLVRAAADQVVRDGWKQLRARVERDDQTS